MQDEMEGVDCLLKTDSFKVADRGRKKLQDKQTLSQKQSKVTTTKKTGLIIIN